MFYSFVVTHFVRRLTSLPLMKCFILLLCLTLTMLSQSLWAQTTTDPCETEFDFDVVITPSTCQANGTVTVNLTGDFNNFHEFHYSVPSAVVGGKVIPPQRENLLQGLPSGRHRVRVDAICKTDINRNQFAEKEIVVPGNYQVIQLDTTARNRTNHSLTVQWVLWYLTSVVAHPMTLYSPSKKLLPKLGSRSPK